MKKLLFPILMTYYTMRAETILILTTVIRVNIVFVRNTAKSDLNVDISAPDIATSHFDIYSEPK